VDTNSEIEDGKGLLVTLSPDFQVVQSIALAGPRDVQVTECRFRPDGSVIFAGSRNGPLTHTDPSMLNNDGMLGTVALSSASP
jgi:hypothetical protein